MNPGMTIDTKQSTEDLFTALCINIDHANNLIGAAFDQEGVAQDRTDGLSSISGELRVLLWSLNYTLLAAVARKDEYEKRIDKLTKSPRLRAAGDGATPV